MNRFKSSDPSLLSLKVHSLAVSISSWAQASATSLSRRRLRALDAVAVVSSCDSSVVSSPVRVRVRVMQELSLPVSLSSPQTGPPGTVLGEIQYCQVKPVERKESQNSCRRALTHTCKCNCSGLRCCLSRNVVGLCPPPPEGLYA